MLMDRTGVSELRQHLRPVHKAYLAEMQDRIGFAGPLLADDGVSIIGSLFLIDFPNREAAISWLKNEPFVQAGVFASTNVQVFANLWPQKVGFPD